MKGINTKIILEQFVVRASGSMAPVNRLEFRHLARRITIHLYNIARRFSKNDEILQKNEL